MMGKYRDVIIRNQMPYDFVSSHESKWRAKFAVRKLKDESKDIKYGFLAGMRAPYVGISTRIIKAKDGRYLVYSRDK